MATFTLEWQHATFASRAQIENVCKQVLLCYVPGQIIPLLYTHAAWFQTLGSYTAAGMFMVCTGDESHSESYGKTVSYRSVNTFWWVFSIRESVRRCHGKCET